MMYEMNGEEKELKLKRRTVIQCRKKQSSAGHVVQSTVEMEERKEGKKKPKEWKGREGIILAKF